MPLMPAAIVVPCVVSWLVYQGQQRGWYDQGKLSLKSHPVDLVSTINATIKTVQLAAQAKGIPLCLSHQSEELSLCTIGDRDRLQQVFWNLLSNAVKFTPEGGRIDF